MTLRLGQISVGPDDGEVLVFLQGWPDNATLWDDAVAALQDDYRCVRTTMPNFDGDRHTRWGYTTEEILDAIATLLRDAGGGSPVTLVMHDWGCYWGHAVHNRNPDLVKRIVSVDISPHFAPGPKAALGLVAYQAWLCGAFFVGGRVGDAMTRSFANLARVPRDTAELDAWMNYPYRNAFADLFAGRTGALTKGYYPTCPKLFVYGEKKPFHFHSERWIEHVKSTGGEVVALPCGHWVPREPAFVEHLVRWLGETNEPRANA